MFKPSTKRIVIANRDVVTYFLFSQDSKWLMIVSIESITFYNCVFLDYLSWVHLSIIMTWKKDQTFYYIIINHRNTGRCTVIELSVSRTECQT